MIRLPPAIPDMGRLRGGSGLGREAFSAKYDGVSYWSQIIHLDGQLARFVLSGCGKNAAASNGEGGPEFRVVSSMACKRYLSKNLVNSC